MAMAIKLSIDLITAWEGHNTSAPYRNFGNIILLNSSIASSIGAD
jgi:hypothetical protein